jgi:hypothetical protein
MTKPTPEPFADPDTLAARYWYALGVHGEASAAFAAAPSDDNAKRRDRALVRLAAARKQLLGDGK